MFHAMRCTGLTLTFYHTSQKVTKTMIQILSGYMLCNHAAGLIKATSSGWGRMRLTGQYVLSVSWHINIC